MQDDKEIIMMTDINTPTNRTFAVIEGGLNVEAGVQKVSLPPKPKLLDQVRQAIRTRHYS